MATGLGAPPAPAGASRLGAEARPYTLTAAELAGYAALERTYWWFAGRRAIVSGLLVPRLAGTHRPTIVDVGCGPGGNLAWLGALGRAVGVDSSGAVLALGQRAGPVIQADAVALPFRTGSVEVLTALDVLEHCPDDAAVLREWWRVCRAGGWALFTVPALPFLWTAMDDRFHYRRYRRRELGRRVEAAGFRVEVLSYFATLCFPLLVVDRVIKKVRRPSMRAYFPRVPGPVAALLRGAMALEGRLLRHLRLPVGGSLVVLARKA